MLTAVGSAPCHTQGPVWPAVASRPQHSWGVGPPGWGMVTLSSITCEQYWRSAGLILNCEDVTHLCLHVGEGAGLYPSAAPFSQGADRHKQRPRHLLSLSVVLCTVTLGTPGPASGGDEKPERKQKTGCECRRTEEHLSLRYDSTSADSGPRKVSMEGRTAGRGQACGVRKALYPCNYHDHNQSTYFQITEIL